MQDIDFDEIDRAVSSVTKPNAPKETSTPVAVEPTPATEAAPVVDAPSVEAPVTVTVETPAVVASPRPSSGRFMDVVHPSSDMRPERTGTSVATPFRREEVADREPVVESTEPEADESAAFQWPDPIEAATPVVEESHEEIPAEVPASAPMEVPTEPKEEVDAPLLESPFLSDAKVEKRPLGAFSGPDTELGLIEEPFPAAAPSDDVETPTTVDEPAEVPRELHDDLLNLEVHGESHETPEVAPAPVDDVPVGPTSITQQYKEQTGTPVVSGSIFDTEVYNQALVHTPKKGTGVKIAVWLVALVLVGGAIGAAIYFVVLPMLG